MIVGLEEDGDLLGGMGGPGGSGGSEGGGDSAVTVEGELRGDEDGSDGKSSE